MQIICINNVFLYNCILFSIFGAGSFLEVLLKKKKKKIKSAFILMYFIMLWISHVFYCFQF